TAAEAVIVYSRQSAVVTVRAAVALAFFSTLPSLCLAVAFARFRARAWPIAAAAWLLAGFLLLVLSLRVPWRSALSIMVDGITFASFALACVLPLALRTTRALLVGFVPLVGLWVTLSTAAGLGIAALGLDLARGITLRAVLIGFATMTIAVAIAVREIRRGAVRRLVMLLAPAFAFGVVAAWRSA